MLFWSGVFQLCVWSGDGCFSPTVPLLCSQMMSASLTVNAAPTSSLCSHTCVIFFPRQAKESILPPSLPPSDVRFFVVHVASCLPVSVTICLSADVSVSSWLPSSSFTPPFMMVSLHIYIIMPWKICVCDNISILWRLPVGTLDTLISWWASCPGSSLLLSLYLFKPFRLTSTPHLTHSD